MDPTEAAARLAVSANPKSGAKSSSDVISKAEDAAYLGCYSSESFFGSKEYVGGASGANYNLIYHHAKQVSAVRVRVCAPAGGGMRVHDVVTYVLPLAVHVLVADDEHSKGM